MAYSNESGTPGLLPVEQVNWFHTLVFCNKLSMLEGLEPVYRLKNSTDPANWGTVPITANATDIIAWNAVTQNLNANGYKLPTEAQWEYAAKGGPLSLYYIYSGGNTVEDVAWHTYGSSSFSHKIGIKLANELGIHDMTGNVQEWGWDWYGDYTSAAQTDPVGPASGTKRTKRGAYYTVG